MSTETVSCFFGVFSSDTHVSGYRRFVLLHEQLLSKLDTALFPARVHRWPAFPVAPTIPRAFVLSLLIGSYMRVSVLEQAGRKSPHIRSKL